MTEFVILQKPPYRSPCNRCGACCKAGPCDLATDFLQAADGELCPALEVEPNGQFSCGLFKRPLHYINPQLAAEAEQINGWVDFSGKVAEFLGFGHGCQMQDEPRTLVCTIPDWA